MKNKKVTRGFKPPFFFYVAFDRNLRQTEHTNHSNFKIHKRMSLAYKYYLRLHVDCFTTTSQDMKKLTAFVPIFLEHCLAFAK